MEGQGVKHWKRGADVLKPAEKTRLHERYRGGDFRQESFLIDFFSFWFKV